METIEPETSNLIYGLKSICSLLKITRPTAIRLLKSGKISYMRVGNGYIFDKEKVLTELETPKQNQQ